MKLECAFLEKNLWKNFFDTMEQEFFKIMGYFNFKNYFQTSDQYVGIRVGGAESN